MSFGLLGGVAAAMASTLLRQGNRTAWAIVWSVPAAFAGSTAVFYTSGATTLGGFYAAATVFAIMSQLQVS